MSICTRMNIRAALDEAAANPRPSAAKVERLRKGLADSVVSFERHAKEAIDLCPDQEFVGEFVGRMASRAGELLKAYNSINAYDDPAEPPWYRRAQEESCNSINSNGLAEGEKENLDLVHKAAEAMEKDDVMNRKHRVHDYLDCRRLADAAYMAWITDRGRTPETIKEFIKRQDDLPDGIKRAAGRASEIFVDVFGGHGASLEEKEDVSIDVESIEFFTKLCKILISSYGAQGEDFNRKRFIKDFKNALRFAGWKRGGEVDAAVQSKVVSFLNNLGGN